MATFYLFNGREGGSTPINIRVFCPECMEPVKVHATKVWHHERDNEPGEWFDVEVEFPCPECKEEG